VCVCVFLQAKLVESIRVGHDEYRAQCRRKDVRISELETGVQHLSTEMGEKATEITQLHAVRDTMQDTVSQLRQQLLEVEEVSFFSKSSKGGVRGTRSPCRTRSDSSDSNYSRWRRPASSVRGRGGGVRFTV
jgi:hypothetical protein